MNPHPQPVVRDPQDVAVAEQHVAAPSAVYSYLTDSERWAQWQGADATIEARPGGLFRMRMGAGQTARGQFVELVRLTHRALPSDEVASHRAGWGHYLSRLGVCADGSDPGPDPGQGGESE